MRNTARQTTTIDADQTKQQQQQQQQNIEATAPGASTAAASSPSSTPQPTHSAESILDQLQSLSLELREQHGLACAILGKDGRVVAFETGKDIEKEGKEEEEKESTAPAIHPAASSSSSASLAMEHFVGHEHADVILKVNDGMSIKHLYASSGMCGDCGADLNYPIPSIHVYQTHPDVEPQLNI